MPPIEPPSTARQVPMPSASASAASTATWSATVTSGNRDPHGAPSGAVEEGPVVPWQPPSTLAQTTNSSSVSSGAPGPISEGHQPAGAGPGPAGPTTGPAPGGA